MTKRGRMAIVDAIKLERGCEDADCAGFPRSPRALTFDHVRGVKAFDISQAVNSLRMMGGTSRPNTRPQKGDVFEKTTMEAVILEIAKCDVVCANCHAVRTATRPTKVRREDDCAEGPQAHDAQTPPPPDELLAPSGRESLATSWGSPLGDRSDRAMTNKKRTPDHARPIAGYGEASRWTGGLLFSPTVLPMPEERESTRKKIKPQRLRPYKCEQAGCERHQGFNSVGSLAQHADDKHGELAGDWWGTGR